MSITQIGSASGTNTATFPAHQIGDLLLVFAYRDGSTTLPGIPAGWADFAVISGSSNSNGARLHAKIATSASETVGTWSNATSVIVVVYRATGIIGIGASAQLGGTSTIIPYAGLTLVNTDNTSGVVAFAGHRSPDTNLQIAPTGMSNFMSNTDATDKVVAHQTNGLVSSWSATSVDVGGTSIGYRTIVVEITETPRPNGKGIGTVTYQAQQFTEDGTGAQNYYSYTGLSAGPAASEKWAIAMVFLDRNDATSISFLTINGEFATYIGETAGTTGFHIEWWKYRIDNSTSVAIEFITDGGTWHSGVVLYTSNLEPTLVDVGIDEAATSNTYSTTLDIPALGSVIAHVVQTYNAPVTWTWTDANEDGESTYISNFMFASWASASDQAETIGATVSAEVSGQYFTGALLSAASFSFPGSLSGISFTEPQITSAEVADPTHTFDVDTKSITDDRIVLIAVNHAPLEGNSAAITSATIGGVPATILESAQFTSIDFGDQIFVEFIAAIVPSGTGNQSVSITFSNTTFNVVTSAWIVRGAGWPQLVDAQVVDGSAISLTVPEGSTAFASFGRFGTGSGTVSFGSTPVTTSSQNGFYGGQNLFGAINDLPASTFNVTAESASVWAAGAAIVFGLPLPIVGTQLSYWTGSAWVSAPLMLWNGTEWVPAAVQRWNGTEWIPA